MNSTYEKRSGKYFFKRGEPEVGLKFQKVEKREQEKGMKIRKALKRFRGQDELKREVPN